MFSDPAKSVGPLDGHQGRRRGARHHGDHGQQPPAGAASADFVVVVAGLTPQDEGEEYTGAGDRTERHAPPRTPSHLGLDPKQNSGVQNALITAVAALGKPMVVVLEGGSVIDMPWLANVPAVVMAWYPGMVGGTALGQLLFGDANFSGKLPHHLGREPQPLADVREQTPARRRWTTTSAIATSTRRARR